MRLLHVHTFKFTKHFFDIPSYVIASHRWTEGDEASLRDVQEKKNTNSGGYKKLEAFVDYVKKSIPGVEWVWMDTCCINQEDAAELSESVNLMFEWYRNAKVCVAFLADVSEVEDQGSFDKSVWFSRGWTLQELLAPCTVIFLTKKWKVIGSKGGAAKRKIDTPLGPSLEGRIAQITGIPERVLHNYEESKGMGVDERLKWMEGRHTTREEDMSYALYGIFGVTPGANYGEKRAGARERLLTAISDRLSSKTDLTKLAIAKGATYDSYMADDFGRCLEGTRTELLSNVTRWSSENNSKPIFWLCGKAGTGKSTISRTVAYNAQVTKRLGASFFFKRGEADRAGARRFFPTVASQLAHTIPGCAFFVSKALMDESDVCDKNPQEQFERLVLQPLLAVASELKDQEALLIVVDALDECEHEADVRMILRLLARLNSIGPLRLRIFVTSRPELPIKLGFRQLNNNLYEDVVLEHVQESTIADDICKYITYRLDRIKEIDILSQPFDPLPSNWPGEESFRVLVRLTVPLFISAFTICRFLAEDDPQARLETILETRKFSSFSDLASTYLPVLNHSVAGADEEETQRRILDFRNLIGAIVVLADPLSAQSLKDLLKIQLRDIGTRLRHLHSVLSIPDSSDTPIRPFHLSFRDFLVDSNGGAGRFWIDEAKTHGWLAEMCLRRLEEPETLKVDILNVGKPGYKSSEISKPQLSGSLSNDAAYACCYWAWHVIQQGHTLEDECHVHRFLRHHFLHWLEALSWLGRLSAAIGYISDLQYLVEIEECPELSIFLEDARRFLLRNRSVIELAPLQTYSSALVFAPTESIIKSQFEDNVPEWLELRPQVLLKWSAETQKLEGHDDYVTAVAFSPDGKTVASGSHDRTVRLWNASTGEQTQQLEGHDHDVTAVAFSPDGKTVASGSYDQTVRLWNASTGEQTQQLEGHDHAVTAVAFSPDGKTVASGLDDRTVRLWNASTGEQTQQLEGHDNAVNAVAFSPDGKTVASGSHDRTVRLWNASTGEQTQQLEGHYNNVTAVAFSPDGKTMASGSHDQTVRLWNASTGEQTQQLEGHDDYVTAVAFSPDGKTVASGSHNRTVRLWNASTGEQTQQLEGHDNNVTAVAFSPDGKTVASGSDDRTVRLWNASTGEQIRQFQDVGYTYRLAFHEHGNFLFTDTSTLDVRTYVSPSQATHSSPATSRIGLRDQWVQSQDQDFLWLPHEYRGRCSAVYGDTLVIGQASGAMSFFRLKSEMHKAG